jgi:hypothetical protein
MLAVTTKTEDVMRRSLLLLATSLLVSSCYSYRPVYVPDQSGALRGRLSPGPSRLCSEVSRSRCDVERCKGSNMDYVTLRCASGSLNRCVLNSKGCSG